MNYVERIKKIKTTISQIENIKNSGDLPASGITVWVLLGPESDTNKNPVVKTELTAELDIILEGILESLKDSVHINTMFARGQYKELQEFFSDEESK